MTMIKLKTLLKESKKDVRENDLQTITSEVMSFFEKNKKAFESLVDDDDWDAFYDKAFDKFPDADQDDVAQALNKAAAKAGIFEDEIDNEMPTEKELEAMSFGDKKNVGKGIKMVDYEKKMKAPKNESFCNCLHEEILEEAEYHNRKVTLNKPFYTPGGPRKRAVYVKNDKGNVVKVGFGDPNMRIKKNIPGRRKSFRARHHCDTPGPRWKARYWSCKVW